MPRELGDRIAPIIGAPPGTVSMHENVTSAQAVALSCFEPDGTRRRIVCPEMDFPSMIYLYREQERLGLELVTVPAEADFTVPTDRMVEAIDERTLIVALSHVLFRTSCIMDVASIAARAREVGAAIILDTYQSAGIIPVDVTTLGVDFAVGGCLKWLCGGPGNAFLYTRPDVMTSRSPRFHGWVAHQHPFTFDPHRFEPRADAMRMMNGTPSIPAYYAALAGLEIVGEVGVTTIREKSVRMTARLLQLVDEYGFQSLASRDPARLAGTVAVDVPDALPVARVLKSRDFLVDYRPGVGIRLSPHFYNTFDEIEMVMGELAGIVRSRDYDPAQPTSSKVT
jgi:kynureninase